MLKLPVKIESIRERVRAGKYLVQSHAIQHALKEGFERQHIIDAVLNGDIIEEYPEVARVLICGTSVLVGKVMIYLHVICEFADPYIEFVTAYVPDESQWEKPTFRRRIAKTG